MEDRKIFCETGVTRKFSLKINFYRTMFCEKGHSSVVLFTKHLTIEISLKRKLASAVYFTKILTIIVSEIFLVTLRVPRTTRKFKFFS